MNNHLRTAVVSGLAIVALFGVSGCKGGGSGGFFGVFDGSSDNDALSSFGGESDEPFNPFGGNEDGFPGDPGGDQGGDNSGPPPIAVVHNPEPMSVGLFGTGLLALGAARRRRMARRSSAR